MWKKIFFGLLLLFLTIQFVRPPKNLSAITGPNDATVCYPTSPEVKQLLHTACYDCHSNHTRYPWYAEVQPVSWWLAHHVKDAKAHLNFSELGAYSKKTAVRRLNECIDEVEERAMPLPSYRIVHPDARLTEAQTKLLTEWFEETRDQIQENPAEKSPLRGAPVP